MGSVFSPYYAWARRRGAADPLDHCAFNAALYGPQARWAMTERGRRHVRREPAALRIGPSAMRFTGGRLEVDIDEICAPLPWRLRGRIVLTPQALHERSYMLEERGSHRWTPYAPCARIEVRLERPAQHWEGVAYFDSNTGDEPLENGFESWTWSRAALPGGTAVLYDVTPRHGAPRSLGLKFDPAGGVEEIEPPPRIALRRSGWGVDRQTRADAGREVSVRDTLEDAPFYSRSLLDTHVGGSPAVAIHESLSLDRFRSPWVQCLLPFRMPRRR